MFETETVEPLIVGAKEGKRRAWAALVTEYRPLFGLVVSSHNLWLYEDQDELWSLALENLPALVRKYTPGEKPYTFFYTGTKQILRWKLYRKHTKAQAEQKRMAAWWALNKGGDHEDLHTPGLS